MFRLSYFNFWIKWNYFILLPSKADVQQKKRINLYTIFNQKFFYSLDKGVCELLYYKILSLLVIFKLTEKCFMAILKLFLKNPLGNIISRALREEPLTNYCN